MEPVLFAAGCFTAAVALAAGIYASFTARGKGPVLSNSYWFSVLKRENANKKAEYRLVTVVFSCLSAIFLLLTVEIFTQWPWTAALRWALIAFVLIYALADAFRTVLKGSKPSCPYVKRAEAVINGFGPFLIVLPAVPPPPAGGTPARPAAPRRPPRG